jgi:uncharacterized protein (TIGR02996 family)
MTDREALYRAILENPAEDTPRLAYADKLEEDGEAKYAEFIRLQIELKGKEGMRLPKEMAAIRTQQRNQVASLFRELRPSWNIPKGILLGLKRNSQVNNPSVQATISRGFIDKIYVNGEMRDYEDGLDDFRGSEGPIRQLAVHPLSGVYAEHLQWKTLQQVLRLIRGSHTKHLHLNDCDLGYAYVESVGDDAQIVLSKPSHLTSLYIENLRRGDWISELRSAFLQNIEKAVFDAHLEINYTEEVPGRYVVAMVQLVRKQVVDNLKSFSLLNADLWDEFEKGITEFITSKNLPKLESIDLGGNGFCAHVSRRLQKAAQKVGRTLQV